MQNKAPRVYKDCSAAKVVWLLVFVAILIIGLAVLLAPDDLRRRSHGPLWKPLDGASPGTWVSAGVLVPSSLEHRRGFCRPGGSCVADQLQKQDRDGRRGGLANGRARERVLSGTLGPDHRRLGRRKGPHGGERRAGQADDRQRSRLHRSASLGDQAVHSRVCSPRGGIP